MCVFLFRFFSLGSLPLHAAAAESVAGERDASGGGGESDESGVGERDASGGSGERERRG